jgi:hypothetical protein
MEWVQILEVFGILGGIATIMGLFLGPMLYLGAKIDAFKDAVNAEMKDFHGKICAIEERNKK